jgi:hypothetical protein
MILKGYYLFFAAFLLLLYFRFVERHYQGYYLFFATILVLLCFKFHRFFKYYFQLLVERMLNMVRADSKFWRYLRPLSTTLASSGVDGKFVSSIVVSIAVLAAGLYIILSKGYEADSQKWAFGAVGTILGYWLRPTGNGS